ncbi:MAG: transcriptional regulator [Methanosarcinales archaeon]|jgi:predicted transcriptional regulator|nr:transcriptional regulator [Methanosarcinales archaeon]
MTQMKTTLNAADLRKIGFSRPMSLALICLSDGKEHTSIDIERSTALRQPEVSIALQSLRIGGFVSCREIKETPGKGRPVKYFKLAVPFSKIISKRVDEIKAESQSLLKTANQILVVCDR